MNTLTLVHDYSSAFTFVQNDFIDYYMKDINESQIKIYLYLLRSIGGNMQVSISSIADFFNDSERDVMRALKYLDKQNLIMLEYDNDKQPKSIRLLRAGESKETLVSAQSDELKQETMEPSPSEKKEKKGAGKKSYSAEVLSGFMGRSDIKELIYVAETYLKRTLSQSDLSALLYINEELGFPVDLIEYLIEYCLSNKKKSLSYMKATAADWAQNDVFTVEDAKLYVSKALPAEIYEVFKAFGIKSRNPIDPEIALVKKWLNTYGLPVEVITEACKRTIMNIHEPSFDYADKILKNWKSAGVRSLSDIEALDNARNLKMAANRKEKAQSKKASSAGKGATDYDAIVKELMDIKQKSAGRP